MLKNGINVGVCDSTVSRTDDLLCAELDHREHLMARYAIDVLRLLLLPVVSALLHDQMVHFQLSGRPFDDLLFHSALGDQPVDNDLLFLAYTMRTVDRLQVDLRVPVTVKNDHDIGLVEVDSQAARSC